MRWPRCWSGLPPTGKRSCRCKDSSRNSRIASKSHGMTRLVRRRRFLWLVVTLSVVALAPFLPGALRSPVVANHALEPVYFDAGRATARADDERTLDTHAAWLKRHRNQSLLIEGHTDGPGRDATSMAIAERRATWAKAYLVSKGVDADRIETISYGGTQPMCTEKTATCRAKNRRATFSTTRR
jgi:OmpA family